VLILINFSFKRSFGIFLTISQFENDRVNLLVSSNDLYKDSSTTVDVIITLVTTCVSFSSIPFFYMNTMLCETVEILVLYHQFDYFINIRIYLRRVILFYKLFKCLVCK